MTRRQLDYICMQPTRQGQASYAHVNEIVAGLRRRGWDVRLVEPRLPRPGRGDGLRRLMAAAWAQLAYSIECRLCPAPYVYIRSHFLTLPVALLARVRGSIVVQEVNGPGSDAREAWPALRFVSGPLAVVMHSQYRMADAVIVVTPGLEGYLRARSGRRRGYRVIGNGADVERFHPVAPRTNQQAHPYAVFVGALASWQGIATVLEAIKSSAWPAGVDLVVAGDGRERTRVEAAADADARVRWLGTIPYAEVPALVAESLAALVPMGTDPRSRFGLSPLKLYEAMASGVPVVASDLPGLGDTVRAHDCGLTFAAGDAVGLARCVAEIAANPVRAGEMGARGRQAAVALYSWDARAGQTEEVLLDLAARRSQSGPAWPTRGDAASGG